MLPKSRLPSLRGLLAMSLLVLVGGGCVAIYGFDDFEKNPPIACVTATDCPGSDACGTRACNGGICQLTNLAAEGALTIRNEPGNCLRFVCDGVGNEIIEIDPENVRSDGDACTEDLCVDDVPINKLASAGTQCGTNANVLCTEDGVCAGCTTPDECGVDTDCVTWTCVDSVCSRNLQPIGKEVANDFPGDCKKKLCNAAGEFPDTFSADDAPDDKDPCTADYCGPNGEILHDPLPEGAKCDECRTCTKDGTCQACDTATSDCHNGACVPKPETCPAPPGECPSKYCVDNYCCNTECSSPCMACDEQLTGVLSGICAPIKNGTDPQAECEGEDFCQNGSCRCANGIQDEGEEGVDCGGVCKACTGTWNCGGPDACNGAVVPICCWDDPLLCLNCPNDQTLCNDLNGKTCVKGTASQKITLGQVTYNKCFWPSNACKQVNCRCE